MPLSREEKMGVFPELPSGDAQERAATSAETSAAWWPVRDALLPVLDFLEEEAANRACAGSEYSDYEREPNELADRLRGVLAQVGEMVAELENARAALAVVRQSLSEQAQARLDPTMPLLSPRALKRLKGEAEATYALAEGRDDRIYSHALDLLAAWQDRAALAKADGQS